MEAEQGLVLSRIHRPAGLYTRFGVLIPTEKPIGLQLSNHWVAAGDCGLDPWRRKDRLPPTSFTIQIPRWDKGLLAAHSGHKLFLCSWNFTPEELHLTWVPCTALAGVYPASQGLISRGRCRFPKSLTSCAVSKGSLSLCWGPSAPCIAFSFFSLLYSFFESCKWATHMLISLLLDCSFSFSLCE